VEFVSFLKFFQHRSVVFVRFGLRYRFVQMRIKFLIYLIKFFLFYK